MTEPALWERNPRPLTRCRSTEHAVAACPPPSEGCAAQGHGTPDPLPAPPAGARIQLRARIDWRMLCVALALLTAAPVLQGQESLAARYQMYGGYSYISNSLNGVSGSHQGLNGWEYAFAIPPWHDLRFKLDAYSYRGTNLGAPQNPWFIVGGGQYGRDFGRESPFGEVLFGVGNANSKWGANNIASHLATYPGDTASFAIDMGGGLDTRLSRRFAFRVQGDFHYSYFQQFERFVHTAPVYVPHLPNYFGRVSTGVVWRF
jgi:hypothetical protein